MAGGSSGPAITAGNSSTSRLIQFVTGENEKKIVMPPEGERLSAQEIGVLRAWIDQGAGWPDDGGAAKSGGEHWAFQRPQPPTVPAVNRRDWPCNPIDAFVLARLEANNIAPAAEADRAKPARRVALDLSGLPPSVEQVEHFVSDSRPDAYERFVDRLLQSPHFGERRRGIGSTWPATPTVAATSSTPRAAFGGIAIG